MDSGLEIRLFGGLQLTLGGSPLTGFTSHKVAALLAFLAVERRPQSRETLATLLWGGLPDADTRNNLRQTLTNLRKLVGPYLRIDRETVAFHPAGICWVDVEAFLDSLNADEGLAPDAQGERWRAASALYVGDFLAGFLVRDAPEFEEWVLLQRARYRELVLHTLHALTEHLTARGEYSRAVETAVRLLALDPWREEAHRQLMRLRARTGQRSAALAQYAICRQVLAQELGVEPSAETTALYERLKSAQRGPRHNLPGNLTGFVGREGELAQLQQRLADPACRLVTLIGPGGIGKTRLATQLAAATVETFLNGCWFVSLSTASPEDLIEHLADAIGLVLRAGNIKKQLLNALGARELLLVLDNFEHLVESAELLSDILRAAPDVKIVVTSRERLDLQSEWVFALDGLALSTEPGADPATYSAGQLFLQVVERQRRSIPAGDEQAAAIREICRMVEGLPLGIELAAARLGALDCAEIVAEIRRSTDFLVTRHRDVPERQRSLRAVVETSVAALGMDERRVFVALAVFPRGFTAEAASQIARTTPQALAALVDKSLVRQSGGRFDLHEVLRRYADEALALEPGLSAELHNRHSGWFASWLAALTQTATAPGAQSSWMSIMADDLDNVRAAWDWASAHGRWADVSRMLEGVFQFMHVRGHFREGVDWLSRAAEALGRDPATTDEPGHLAARLSVARARFLLELGQSDTAVSLFEAGREYFELVVEPRQLARCLNGLGTAARAAGQFERARGFHSEQLTVAREHALRDEEAGALNNLGVVVSDMGDSAAAIELHRECLALRRALGDRVGVASSLINLSTALVDHGDDTQAVSLLEEALVISREYNDARRTGAVLTNLGAAARRAGRFTEEREYYQQALAVHRESGHRLGIALALNNLGSVEARLGHDEAARRNVRAALAEAQAGQFDFVALDALVTLALLAARSGDAIVALEWLALPLHDPAAVSETVAAARALLPDLSRNLPVAAVAIALERGRSQSLLDVVRHILASS